MGQYLSDLWKFRGLIASLTRKELKGKYAQTRLGAIWAFMQPLLVLLIFTVLFDQLIHLDTAEIPYPIFAFSGMYIWYLFTNLVQSGGNALIGSQDLMKKIYFPKLVLPISQSLVAVLESSVSLLLLFILLLLYKVELSPQLLLFPLVLLLTLILGFTLAIWLSAFSVKNRDLQHFLPHLINTGIWLTPVFYPSSLIPKVYLDYFYYLNPVATLIELFRSMLFETDFYYPYLLSFLLIFAFLIWGLYQFKSAERNMADYI